MTRTPPQHGERRCYLRGCRRPECSAANYRYMSRLRLDYERGEARRAPAAPVLEHLRQLINAGWTQAQIERATGVGHRTIGPVIAETCTKVSTTTARKILALPISEPPTDEVDTDAIGTIRRLQALAAIGHNYPTVAARVGIHKDALGVIARGDRTSVRTETAKAVAAAYRLLSRTPGTSVRTRLNAARLGWQGPLAWDDTTIDDPAATPETDDSTERFNRNQLAVYRREEVTYLDGCGIPTHEIADRLGMSVSTVRGIVRELHVARLSGDREVAA